MYTNNITSDQHTFKLHTSPWPAEILNIFNKISRNTNSLKSEEILLVLNQQICRNPHKILLVLIILLVLFIRHGQQKKTQQIQSDDDRRWRGCLPPLKSVVAGSLLDVSVPHRVGGFGHTYPACMHARENVRFTLPLARRGTEEKNGEKKWKNLAAGEEPCRRRRAPIPVEKNGGGFSLTRRGKSSN